jgi:hypothetical protein
MATRAAATEPSPAERERSETVPDTTSTRTVEEPEGRETATVAGDPPARERAVRESQERALVQERERDAQRHAERERDIGGMEM